MSDQSQVRICKKHGPQPLDTGFRKYVAYNYKGRDIYTYRCLLCQGERSKGRYSEEKKQATYQWRKDHPEDLAKIQKRCYEKHGEAYKKQMKQRREALRLRVLQHYSSETPSCACCQEKNIEFLCLDHINNDGAEHRKELKKKTEGYWSWVERNGYPPGYRVLCHNCNHTYAVFGNCPHQPNFVQEDVSKLTPGKRHSRKLKNLVLKHYGGNPPHCACCQETESNFLAIDHVNGGGREHRRRLKESVGISGDTMFYRWVIYEDYPPMFRILCHNCNFAHGAYDHCPHQPSQ